MKSNHWRQGDVLVIERKIKTEGLKPVPREGGKVVLAHGEVTGHTHALSSRGAHLFAMESERITGQDAAQIIARLGGGLIPDRALSLDKPAELRHEEHSTIKLPAGTHIVRIQREYAPGSLRSVAD